MATVCGIWARLRCVPDGCRVRMPAHAWTTDLNLVMHRDSWADMPQTAGSNPEMLDQFGLDELPKATLTTQIQRRLAPKVEPQY
eukprot:COSAG01_NODE_8228_length_2865_cov_3.592914_4_plen_84_part_00